MGTLEDLLGKSPDTEISLHGGPAGEPGGGSFAGTFERKEKDIRVPFLDPEAIKILCLRAIWNLSKEQGCPELIADCGAQRACL
jgi:hypothetical protein